MQELTTTNANYPIIFSKTTNTNTTKNYTNTFRRSNNFYINPNTGILYAPSINCSSISVSNPTYTLTKTSGAWNVGTISAARTGNVVHLQIILSGTGTVVGAGTDDGFMGTLGGSDLPALPIKFVDYSGNNVLIMYIDTSGNVKVRLVGSNLTLASGSNLIFSGTFIVN